MAEPQEQEFSVPVSGAGRFSDDDLRKMSVDQLRKIASANPSPTPSRPEVPSPEEVSEILRSQSRGILDEPTFPTEEGVSDFIASIPGTIKEIAKPVAVGASALTGEEIGGIVGTGIGMLPLLIPGFEPAAAYTVPTGNFLGRVAGAGVGGGLGQKAVNVAESIGPEGAPASQPDPWEVGEASAEATAGFRVAGKALRAGSGVLGRVIGKAGDLITSLGSRAPNIVSAASAEEAIRRIANALDSPHQLAKSFGAPLEAWNLESQHYLPVAHDLKSVVTRLSSADWFRDANRNFAEIAFKAAKEMEDSVGPRIKEIVGELSDIQRSGQKNLGPLPFKTLRVEDLKPRKVTPSKAAPSSITAADPPSIVRTARAQYEDIVNAIKNYHLTEREITQREMAQAGLDRVNGKFARIPGKKTDKAIIRTFGEKKGGELIKERDGYQAVIDKFDEIIDERGYTIEDFWELRKKYASRAHWGVPANEDSPAAHVIKQFADKFKKLELTWAKRADRALTEELVKQQTRYADLKQMGELAFAADASVESAMPQGSRIQFGSKAVMTGAAQRQVLGKEGLLRTWRIGRQLRGLPVEYAHYAPGQFERSESFLGGMVSKLGDKVAVPLGRDPDIVTRTIRNIVPTPIAQGMGWVMQYPVANTGRAVSYVGNLTRDLHKILLDPEGFSQTLASAYAHGIVINAIEGGGFDSEDLATEEGLARLDAVEEQAVEEGNQVAAMVKETIKKAQTGGVEEQNKLVGLLTGISKQSDIFEPPVIRNGGVFQNKDKLVILDPKDKLDISHQIQTSKGISRGAKFQARTMLHSDDEVDVRLFEEEKKPPKVNLPKSDFQKEVK